MEKKMNKKWLTHIIAAGTLAAFVVLGLASASTPPAKKFENAEALKGYLDGQSANNADAPLNVAVTADDSTLKDTVEAINSAGKYVNLDLSESALTTIPPDTFKDCIYIIGITLPSNPDLLKSYLDGLPANTADKPIRVSIAVDDQTIKNVGDIIRAANKYVILTLNPIYNDGGRTANFLKIPDNAFKDCKRLVGIGLPFNVNEIGDSAFANTGITSIFLPENVAKISYNAFWGCENLTAIKVSDYNKTFSSSDQGVLFTKDFTGLAIFPQGKTGSYTVMDRVEYIAPYAFYGSSISNVTLHGGVNLRTGDEVTIGDSAFINCTKLTSVTLNGQPVFETNKIFDGNFFEVWDKANPAQKLTSKTTGREITARDGSFKGTFTRAIGSNTWTFTK
ncbi:MAG: leucine-rich repeat domain-containing protein [Treponema sp.]|jgi:hypothetical protein|nr:leucine-rich repeat domain-containing protein [Treponema sp.]